MQKQKLSYRERLARFFDTTAKCLVWFFSLNSALWIWCSYVLAFMGRVDIAESLSSTVCTVCIGSLVMYIISKTVENVFKYNDFGGPRVPYEVPTVKKEEVTNESTSFN